MPVRAALVVLLCAGFASSTSAGEEFPYVAYVRADGVFHRSGPGQEYYPTGKLLRGASVEVYHHDPSGWCAIRPPAGSFSWVRVADLKPVAGNFAAVTSEGAAARVGSSLRNQRDVEQVRLERGEEVEIVEGESDEAAGGSPGWLRIAPPSGEFRWVALDDLSRDLSGEEDAGDIAASASAAPEAGQSTTPNPAGSSVAVQIAAIDLALANVVSQDPAAWSFDGLWAEAEAVLEQTETAAQTGRIRAIMKRMTRFEEIQRRHAALAGAAGSDAADADVVLDEPATGQAARVTIDARYDGVGTLARVASGKVGDPQFALIDGTGTVREYVTAAPGVNLSRYLGRQVGINGLRGTLPMTGDRHVTAQRVTALESRLVR